ncbi:unnamed protein product [Didymodactylos carnosus]|uniref:Cation efflux protein cytoplasmic domain-containing protein n=1 Tax=Didymodactylos carnosus TaxID=1234261 RepID=A0A8S2EBU2_9BILA|nr:unnamed protein product [Didymodactylos carnosus]CAF3994221.1 unnamed protein product [Didymodactylos carnosus]
MNLVALLFGYIGSVGTRGKWTEKLIITDDIGAICLAIYEHVQRACHRIVENSDTQRKIQTIAANVLEEIKGSTESVHLGETIICHGGDDTVIVMQMITLPNDMVQQRTQEIFGRLKQALEKIEDVGHVIVHWEF